jgi:coenzyme PQQ precursor peptide PqqA
VSRSIHENHEAGFMGWGLPARRAGGEHVWRDEFVPRRPAPAWRLRIKEMNMTWQTPQAQDLRFGFEITMYIAAR